MIEPFRFRMRLILFVLFAFASAGPAWAQSIGELIHRRGQVSYDGAPRRVLAFYYPWYGYARAGEGSGADAHWGRMDLENHDLEASTHYPAGGPYDSLDPRLVARQCRQAKEAGIDTFVSSWWGHGNREDHGFDLLLDTCKQSGMTACPYYEVVPPPVTPKSAADDLLRLLRRCGDHPAWLRVENKPVVFVYSRALDQLGLFGWAETVDRVNREYPGGVFFVGDSLSAGAARVFDGIHTYNTAGQLRGLSVEEARAWAEKSYPRAVDLADQFGRIGVITVIPGYDDTKIRVPGLKVPRHDGELYSAQWQEAIQADPHWVVITSWNEWHEGSEIEPSLEDGDKYLNLTRRFAEQFHALGASRERKSVETPFAVPDEVYAELAGRWKGTRAAVLPGAGLDAQIPLLRSGIEPVQVDWADLLDAGRFNARNYPILLYNRGETYQPTVQSEGDVNAALRRYLREGGLLLMTPTGPMPMHYDLDEHAVAAQGVVGLPLSAEPHPPWETPPPGRKLRFISIHDRLPDAGCPFAFPEDVDPRWRPFVIEKLPAGSTADVLLRLVDEQGNDLGDAVAYIRHETGDLQGGRLIYIWSGLSQTSRFEAILADALLYATRREK